MAKTVLITGTSSGFGAAAAALFLARGWNVAATSRRPVADAVARPARLALALDVTDRASIDAAVAATLARFGAIDVLVNNAGFGLMGPIEGASAADLRRQFDTNLLGLVATTQAVLPAMRAAGGGTIVNISSMGGRLTLPLFAAYHASKFAVEGLTEAMQYEMRPHGIRMKLVEPGGARTGFDGRMIRATHPAYAEMMVGMSDIMASAAEALPGPGMVARTILRAASSRSARLRYPVATVPYLAIRTWLGERVWRAMMHLTVRRALHLGRAEAAADA